MSGFRYSAPVIIPDTSQVKDYQTQLELTYLLNGMRTLSLHLDQLTGGLSPLKVDWSQYAPDGVYVATQMSKVYAICSDAIPFGAMVNLYLNAGILTARFAQASGFAKAAAGFCNEPSGFAIGEYGEFICGPGINIGIGGLTIGNWYYLDPVSVTGQVTAVKPVAVGQVVQLCGIAIAANKLLCGAFNNWSVI